MLVLRVSFWLATVASLTNASFLAGMEVFWLFSLSRASARAN